MIITDIKQIDRIVEEVLGTTKGVISIDMRDYAFIKKQSSSLKAVVVDVSEITRDSLLPLSKTLKEVCVEKEYNLLMYICGSGICDGEKAVTVEQINMLNESIEQHVSEGSNVIWGLGESMTLYNGITILVVVGSCE